MSVLSAQTIRRMSGIYGVKDRVLTATGRIVDQGQPRPLIWPFREREVFRGMSFGLSSNGYDCRIGPSLIYPGGVVSRTRLDPEGPMIVPARSYVLAATIEKFELPNWICMKLYDKSTWIRLGLRLGTTIAEAGWR